MSLNDNHLKTSLPMIPCISFNLPSTGTPITMPISDHSLMVQNTKFGAIASLNMLNPGSPLAPIVGEALMGRSLGSREMVRLPQSVENERLDKMAAYIVQAFRAGVGLLCQPPS